MYGSQDSDEGLMAQVVLGRRECLERLVRRYASRLLTLIQRMTGDHHWGEELFQEVFLAVWSKRRHYHFPLPFKPWLYTIAINQCRLWYRRRRPLPLSLDGQVAEPLAAGGPEPDELLVATETVALVGTAVQRLPLRQRTVVVLRVWEEMSYANIAETLGCTEATARTHMHLGLQTLRRELEPRLC